MNRRLILPVEDIPKLSEIANRINSSNSILKAEILKAIASGQSRTRVAVDFGVSPSSVSNIVSLFKYGGANAVFRSDISNKSKYQLQLAKQRSELEIGLQERKATEARQTETKKQVQVIETKRDDALTQVKLRQEQEVAKFKQTQENLIADRKKANEKELADYKDAREQQLKLREKEFDKTQKQLADAFQKQQHKAEQDFQKRLRDEDRAYQKEKQAKEKAFTESLRGAGTIIDREAALGTAKPEDVEKLQAKYREEDAIRKQVESTNVDTKSTKEQFASQAKQIAGVQQIRTEEEAAKVRLALQEIEAKAKAKRDEEERLADEKYEDAKRLKEKAFQDAQKLEEQKFTQAQNEAKFQFEQTVIHPAKRALEDEINQKKLAFEREVIQPLKLQQEAEMATVKRKYEEENKAIKQQFEEQIEAVRRAAKLKEFDIDAQYNRLKLDREAVWREQQRALDIANAKKIAEILRAAKSGEVVQGAIPKFSSGVQNFGGGLAYVHAGEVLMNLSRGTSVIPASQVSQIANNNGMTIGSLTVQAPDPVGDVIRVVNEMTRQNLRTARA